MQALRDRYLLPVDVMHIFMYVSDVVFGWKELVEVGNGGLQFHREEGLSGMFFPLLQRNEAEWG